MPGSTHLAAADNQHLLALDLPREDQTPAPLHLRKLCRCLSHTDARQNQGVLLALAVKTTSWRLEEAPRKSVRGWALTKVQKLVIGQVASPITAIDKPSQNRQGFSSDPLVGLLPVDPLHPGRRLRQALAAPPFRESHPCSLDRRIIASPLPTPNQPRKCSCHTTPQARCPSRQPQLPQRSSPATGADPTGNRHSRQRQRSPHVCSEGRGRRQSAGQRQGARQRQDPRPATTSPRQCPLPSSRESLCSVRQQYRVVPLAQLDADVPLAVFLQPAPRLLPRPCLQCHRCRPVQYRLAGGQDSLPNMRGGDGALRQSEDR